MDKPKANRRLNKISELHKDLNTKIREHESFFQDGSILIEERLKPIPNDYDNRIKEAIIAYIDKIFNELYHIEIEGDKDFKKAFQGVITSDVERFKEQNDYLEKWVDFAVISGTIDSDIERALKNAIAELVALQKDAASGGNLGRVYQKANKTYDDIFNLREQLKKYSYENYHESEQRDTSSQIKVW